MSNVNNFDKTLDIWTYGHDNELDDAEMELSFSCLSMSSYISNSSFYSTALLTILMHFSVEAKKGRRYNANYANLQFFTS